MLDRIALILEEGLRTRLETQTSYKPPIWGEPGNPNLMIGAREGEGERERGGDVNARKNPARGSCQHSRTPPRTHSFWVQFSNSWIMLDQFYRRNGSMVLTTSSGPSANCSHCDCRRTLLFTLVQRENARQEAVPHIVFRPIV